MITKHEVRTATAADVPAMAAALGRAYLDDPLLAYLIPDDARRARSIGPFYEALLKAIVPRQAHSRIFTTGAGIGVSIWQEPGHWKTPPRVMLRAVPGIIRAVGIGSLARSVSLMKFMEKRHPEEPHWYLDGLGTDPAHQRTGVGAALMAPILELCDTDGVPAYLETQKPENVAYYRHHGFEVSDQAEFKGLPLWFMWRNPR